MSLQSQVRKLQRLLRTCDKRIPRADKAGTLLFKGPHLSCHSRAVGSTSTFVTCCGSIPRAHDGYYTVHFYYGAAHLTVIPL